MTALLIGELKGQCGTPLISVPSTDLLLCLTEYLAFCGDVGCDCSASAARHGQVCDGHLDWTLWAGSSLSFEDGGCTASSPIVGYAAPSGSVLMVGLVAR